MRAIFLDVDGVLNTPKTWGAWVRFGDAASLEPDLVARARALAVRCGAKMVLSSTWRLHDGYENTLVALAQRGWPDAREWFVGRTPDHRSFQGEATTRGAEIQAWLDGRDDVEAFVILDDDADMLHLDGRLVLVDAMVGLTEEDVERAAALLCWPEALPAAAG